MLEKLILDNNVFYFDGLRENGDPEAFLVKGDFFQLVRETKKQEVRLPSCLEIVKLINSSLLHKINSEYILTDSLLEFSGKNSENFPSVFLLTNINSYLRKSKKITLSKKQSKILRSEGVIKRFDKRGLPINIEFRKEKPYYSSTPKGLRIIRVYWDGNFNVHGSPLNKELIASVIIPKNPKKYELKRINFKIKYTYESCINLKKDVCPAGYEIYKKLKEELKFLLNSNFSIKIGIIKNYCDQLKKFVIPRSKEFEKLEKRITHLNEIKI